MADQQAWTQDETNQLIALRSRGLGPTEIGRELKRTRDSVRHKIKFLKRNKITIPVAVKEVKKEEERPLRKKEQTGYVTYPLLEWCGQCHSPVSNWVDHHNRMGCKKPA